MYLEQIRPPRAVEQRKDNHMGIKIGINGFGRIGRVVLRILADDPERFDVCGINLRKADVDYMVYLLKYDSVFRNFPGIVEHAGGDLIVNGRKIKVYSESDAAMINWADCGAEYIIESTGAYNTTEKASRHFKGGAKKVILTAPGKDEVTPTFVMGVNHMLLHSDMKVVSNASCTTNCLAPVAKALHDGLGINKGLMTTIHAFTNDQVLTDVRHQDLRRARSAVENMIPTKTGAAKAVGLVLPQLKGKLDGFAVRVPTINVSLVDLTFEAGRDTSVEEVNALVKAASEGAMKNVLGYNTLPLVSMDFNHSTQASTFDSTLTKVSNGNMVKVLAWYDNEWGFSCQMLNTARALFGMPVTALD